MGNKHGNKMDRKRSETLSGSTNFSAEEVISLSEYFQGIAQNKNKKELVIDRNIFKVALGLKESLFINRMFLMFDTGTYKIVVSFWFSCLLHSSNSVVLLSSFCFGMCLFFVHFVCFSSLIIFYCIVVFNFFNTTRSPPTPRRW